MVLRQAVNLEPYFDFARNDHLLSVAIYKPCLVVIFKSVKNGSRSKNMVNWAIQLND